MATKTTEEKKTEVPISICGIIMPISDTEPYPIQHWASVKAILEEVVLETGYFPNLVSDADEVGIIHNRIVTNIAENTVIICDVSSKNPNVMFELGLRLAFDKPTIIIKDELTNYTFDTGTIEHLHYPSDLNYHLINEFKIKLKSKLINTVKAAEDPNYSTFLKHFVVYKRQLETKELDNIDYITKQFEVLNRRLDKIETPFPTRIEQSNNKKIGGTTQVSSDRIWKYVTDTMSFYSLTWDQLKSLDVTELINNLSTIIKASQKDGYIDAVPRTMASDISRVILLSQSYDEARGAILASIWLW